MKHLLLAFPVLLLYRPLLLERSYGGGGEALALLFQGLVGSVVMTVYAVVLVKLSGRAIEAHRAHYHKFLKVVGIVLVVFVVVYALASIGSHS